MTRTGYVLITVVTLVLGGLAAYHFRYRLLDELPTDGAPVPIASANVSESGPGSLLSAMTMPSLTRRVAHEALAARVIYRSTEGDTGRPTVVSGAVFTPSGQPPANGWPVVAIGHGTTGIDEPCAPSLSKRLLDQAPIVEAALDLGYAVAMPDYQGLGADGVHPYLDARTAAFNVIDAVRALRFTFPNMSTRWGAYGQSQGGGAVWAADEQAAAYAPELNLVGVVALAPAANVTGVVQRAQDGTLTADQMPLFQWLLTSLGRVHPDLDLDDFRRGAAAEYWEALSACSGPLIDTRNKALREIRPRDLAPATPQAADRLRALLQEWALPQARLSAPLSVVYGDADTYLDHQWTADAIHRACSMGGTVVSKVEHGKGHLDLDGSDQVQWLIDRFGGVSLNEGCNT